MRRLPDFALTSKRGRVFCTVPERHHPSSKSKSVHVGQRLTAAAAATRRREEWIEPSTFGSLEDGGPVPASMTATLRFGRLGSFPFLSAIGFAAMCSRRESMPDHQILKISATGTSGITFTIESEHYPCALR